MAVSGPTAFPTKKCSGRNPYQNTYWDLSTGAENNHRPRNVNIPQPGGKGSLRRFNASTDRLALYMRAKAAKQAAHDEAVRVVERWNAALASGRGALWSPAIRCRVSRYARG